MHESLAELVASYAEHVIGETETIYSGDVTAGKRHTMAYWHAWKKLRESGDAGREALATLLTHERADVRSAAAADLLRYKHDEAMAVLKDVAAGNDLVAFMARECIKRWENAEWHLDPDSSPAGVEQWTKMVEEFELSDDDIRHALDDDGYQESIFDAYPLDRVMETINVEEVRRGRNWFIRKDINQPRSLLQKHIRVLPRAAEGEMPSDTFVVYSTIVHTESTGEVFPALMIREVGELDYGGDYLLYADGKWRQPEDVQDFQGGEEYVSHPLPHDRSFDGTRARHRRMFQKLLPYLESTS